MKKAYLVTRGYLRSTCIACIRITCSIDVSDELKHVYRRMTEKICLRSDKW